LAALLIPAAGLGLAGAFALPAASWATGARPPQPARAEGAQGFALAMVLAAGGVAAAALLALALQRGFAWALPDLGWRPRTGIAFALWLLLAATASRLLGAAAPPRLRLLGAAVCAVVAGVVLVSVFRRRDRVAEHRAAHWHPRDARY
jgi:hypothetical protein